jgi:hypothetical protein
VSRRLIINGGRQPRELVLVGRMVVGRDPACDVSESDPLLSRRHAEFVAGAREVTVRDLGSRNGILVNGVKRPHAVLRGGDVVQVGHLQVRFEDAPGPFLDRPQAGEDPLAALPTVLSAAAPAPRAAGARADARAERLEVAHTNDFEPTLKVPPEPRMGERAGPDPNHTRLAEEPMEMFFGPGNRICFEKPSRGWRVVPGGASTIVSMAHESGHAAVVVERAATGPWFVPGEATAALAEREVDAIVAHDPEAAAMEAAVVSAGDRRVVSITYARTGVAGPEQVRQYSIPAGSGLFRVTCSASAARFTSFEPVFAHVAATFATGT